MKRFLRICFVMSALCIAFLLPFSVTPSKTYAADGGTKASESSSDRDPCRGILGFNSWDCNITDPNKMSSQEELKTNIWIIASNVAIDIVVAASYLIIGYVIYGGYLYTFSGGDPGKIATGRKTLAQAFTGLAIVMLANIILSTLRIALTAGKGSFENCVSTGGCVKPDEMVSWLIGWVVGIVGIVSAAFLVYGAILYITSSGDPAKTKKARDTIMYSLIGLAIVALASMITAFVSNTIRDAVPSSSYIESNNTKEIS